MIGESIMGKGGEQKLTKSFAMRSRLTYIRVLEVNNTFFFISKKQLKKEKCRFCN